jgi:hypothetical protein
LIATLTIMAATFSIRRHAVPGGGFEGIDGLGAAAIDKKSYPAIYLAKDVQL